MKILFPKDNRIWPRLLIAISCIALLIGLALLLAGKQWKSGRIYHDLSSRASRASQACATARSDPSAGEPADGRDTGRDASSSDDIDPESIIFVGDSRTVGMRDSMADFPDACYYCAASGEGYDWFKNTGYAQMERLIQSHPQSPVVFNLGVNDLHDLKRYLDLYRTLDERFPGTEFYYMSVNPVTEKAPQVKNETIENFNRSIEAVFPKRFIDTYHWMKETGFECGDGLHYSSDTYHSIHDYTIEWIRENSV